MSPASPPDYLLKALPHLRSSRPNGRPHVTLTYAQSIDARIAGKDGAQLVLSSEDSMLMTHWIRTLHDAIMIGVGTAVNDDPQLNTRHLPSPHPNPRPVVLDPTLRLPPTCKLLANYNAKTGHQPWVICASSTDDGWKHRYESLRSAGAEIIQLNAPSSLLSLPDVLNELANRKIKSLMVEGGARVIQSFLHSSLVDALIVTVAPTLVGADGLSYASNLPAGLHHLHTQLVGLDAVMFFIHRDARSTSSIHM